MTDSAAAAQRQADDVDRGGPQLETLRASLRFFRIRQYEVAERAGVSRSLLSRQLRGQAPLDSAVCRAAGELMLGAAQSRMRSDRRLRVRVAYHEAGHAVVGHILGQWVRRLSIVPHALWGDRDDGTGLTGVALGGVCFHPRGERDDWWLRRDLTRGSDRSTSGPRAKELCRWGLEDATLGMAGAQAVTVHLRKPQLIDGWDYDTTRRIFDALWSCVVVEPESLKARAWDEWWGIVEGYTSGLVWEHWAAIGSVAEALLERETLTAKRFARIVEPHLAQLRAA